MSERVTVRVWLKVEGWFAVNPYEAGDVVYEVLRFETEFCGHELLLRTVVEQLNISEPQADWAIQYRRQRHNRSLSVGDVVVVGEQAFAVEPVGWRTVHIDAHLIWHDGEAMYLVPDDEAIAD